MLEAGIICVALGINLIVTALILREKRIRYNKGDVPHGRL